MVRVVDEHGVYQTLILWWQPKVGVQLFAYGRVVETRLANEHDWMAKDLTREES